MCMRSFFLASALLIAGFAPGSAQSESEPIPEKGTPEYQQWLREWHRQNAEAARKNLEEHKRKYPDAHKDGADTWKVDHALDIPTVVGIVMAVDKDGIMTVAGVAKQEGQTFQVKEMGYVPDDPKLLKALVLGRLVECFEAYKTEKELNVSGCFVEFPVSSKGDKWISPYEYPTGSDNARLQRELLRSCAKMECDSTDEYYISKLPAIDARNRFQICEFFSRISAKDRDCKDR